MSSDFPPFGSQPPNNPFGSSSPNPYASPNLLETKPDPQRASPAKIIAPGIALVVVGFVGFCLSTFNVVFANVAQGIGVDPQAPEFLQEMQKGAVGIVPTIVQSIFIVVNLFIVLGGVQMIRIATWPLAIAASIVAMINFGSCCCLPGIPVGIWSLVILLQEDVRLLFKLRSQGVA